MAAAMLTGCGRMQAPIGAPGTMSQSIVEPLRRHLPAASLLYVPDYNHNIIEIYDANAKDPSPIGSITDDLFEPVDACVDAKGTVYATNEGPTGKSWVSEYPVGQGKPSALITKGISSPNNCTIDAKGDLWVANLGEGITAYKKGAKKPYLTLTNGFTYEDGIAIDRSGNLYVSNAFGPKGPGQIGNVVVFSPGRRLPSRTITAGVTFPVGLALDAKGDLFVANESWMNSYTGNVTEYLSGQSQPHRVITQGLEDPVGLIIDKAGLIYVSDDIEQAILEFRPGSKKPMKRDITNGIWYPGGLGYYPPLLP
jgi:sugar lactone lactonase YvrE